MASSVQSYRKMELRYFESEPGLRIISDPRRIAAMLPSYSIETVISLLNVDRGIEGSNMTTVGLAYAVKNDEVYLIRQGRLEIAPYTRGFEVIDLEGKAAHPERIETPPYIEMQAHWDPKPEHSGTGNNILGDNGQLILEKDLIDIPLVDATDPLLAYYGATLVKEGDKVQFPDREFPLFLMQVGEGYVPNTLMSDRGGGFYLEYHHDAPHFHMPICGGGCYLLAKWSEDHMRLQMTGFKIPDGQAVYSKKGAIHCDAALTGELIVGYTIAEDCSTVILQNREGKRAELRFHSS